ncbi:MAG: asparagine synthase (glutamine-hydrolyzing) [Chloroflexi bacterium]|nr:asparagine synthase (glutamine-hydrolyzing) [Chloroflexota bacterium]
MCGIAGILRLDGRRPDDGAALRAMSESLVHRGPDGQGSFIRGPMRMTTRRLSIIDLQGGDQPMSNETGTVHVVFNGEIYNFVELRESLAGHGHRFRTRSDTETIVHAYEQWGDEFVNHLNGMFAIALWDEARARLLLARDRAGIKPLYFAHLNGVLVFGSELKALLKSGLVPRELDYEALGQYLSLEYIPAPASIVRGVRKLRPGHLLTASMREVRDRAYWDLSLGKSEVDPPPGEERDHVRAFREVLQRAVRQEMVSDVPIGVLLSGGIDSSTVAAVMTEATDEPVQSFSVSFAERWFDESPFARRVASHLGTSHHELRVTPSDLYEALPTILTKVDEPLADPSIVPTYLVSRFARQHVKVVLSGDGGDEVLAGYSTLQAHRLAPLFRMLPATFRHAVVERAAAHLPASRRFPAFDFLLRRFIQGADAPPWRRHQMLTGALYGEAKSAVLHPDVRHTINDPAFDSMLASTAAASGVQHPLNRILYQDFKLYLEGDILAKTDRASMAASLETRVPLLNADVLSYLERVPLALKLRGRTRKYLLRQAVVDLLPRSIIRRRKRGFSIPIAAWLNDDLRPLAHEHLNESRLQREGIFNPPEVARLLDEHARRAGNHAKSIWTILMFQLWRERWLDAL